MSKALLIAVLFTLCSFVTACSSSSKKSSEPSKEDQVSTLQNQVKLLADQLTQMSARVEQLETTTPATPASKLSETVAKAAAATEVSSEDLTPAIDMPPANTSKAPPKSKKVETVVTAHPAQNKGSRVQTKEDVSDPTYGYLEDEAVQRYRSALVLFESAKYPQAVLEFNGFTKDFADHPLAGSAQFFTGESYFQQKEYKFAIDEFKRVLISFDHSSYLPDALRRLVDCYEELRMNKESSEHQKLLAKLFPSSPAASSIRSENITINDSQSAVPTAPLPTSEKTQEGVAH